MLVIERGPNREDVATPATWESIRDLEIKACDAWVDLVRQTGGIVGEVHRPGCRPYTYEARIITAAEVVGELQERVPTAAEYYCEVVTDSESTHTRIVDIVTGEGATQEVFEPFEDEPPDLTQYNKVEPGNWQHYGQKLLEEIFIPGSYPELSKYAQKLKGELVDPDGLPARLITPEESRLSYATAHLGLVTVRDLTELILIYNEVAQPVGGPRLLRESELTQRLETLKRGTAVYPVHGSRYFNGTKLDLHPSLMHKSLKTSVYPNCEVKIPPVNLYFKEDIEMRLAYALQARQYFKERNIAFQS